MSSPGLVGRVIGRWLDLRVCVDLQLGVLVLVLLGDDHRVWNHRDVDLVNDLGCLDRVRHLDRNPLDLGRRDVDRLIRQQLDDCDVDDCVGDDVDVDVDVLDQLHKHLGHHRHDRLRQRLLELHRRPRVLLWLLRSHRPPLPGARLRRLLRVRWLPL